MQHRCKLVVLLSATVFLHLIVVDAHDLCPDSDSIGAINTNATACELDEVTTVDEQNAILANVCGVVGTLNRTLLVPTVQHRSIDAGDSLADHCAGRTRGFLKWVTWSFYERYMHEPLNFMEKYLDRRIAATNATDVLIEVLPVHYEWLDVHPVGVRSVQIVRAVQLGSLGLSNKNANGSQIVYGKIPYAFERLLNVHVLGNDQLIAGLSVRTTKSADSAAEKLPDLIYGHRVQTVQHETYVFSKELPAAQNSTATLLGSWAVQEYNVTANMVSIYAPNVNRSTTITAKVADTGIVHVHVSFSTDIPRLVANAPSFISLPDRRPPVVYNDTQDGGLEDVSRIRSDSDEVYPGFRPYFYLACIVLFGTMFVVFADVGRKLLDDRNRKHRALETVAPGGDVELLIAAGK